METVHCWHTWNVCELIGEMFVVDLTVCYSVCESMQCDISLMCMYMCVSVCLSVCLSGCAESQRPGSQQLNCWTCHL